MHRIRHGHQKEAPPLIGKGRPNTGPGEWGIGPNKMQPSPGVNGGKGKEMGNAKASMEANEFDYQVIYKPEEDKLVCEGILKAFRFGTNKFDTKTEKYFVSIYTVLDAATREDIKDRYFAEAKEKYIPEPFREIKDGPCYFNLKSLYEIPVFKQGEGNKKYSYDEVIEMGDGLPPYGSTVKLSMRLKEGAIYPLALQIIEIRKANADDYFD